MKPSINQAALRPWAIFRCSGEGYNKCVARFRSRSDAEAYLNILRQLSPYSNFQIAFDQGEVDQ